MDRLGHWIDGKQTFGTGETFGAVFDPSTGRRHREVAYADAGDVDDAVESARRASVQWAQSSLTERAAVMFRFRDLLHADRAELARVLTAEHGKVLSDADGEIGRGIENVEYACGVAELLKGSRSEQVSSGVDVHASRRPLGVVAGITPFNFPAMVPLWMMPNAIVCGNAFVLKPSERDPSVPLRLAELLSEAGLPDGVCNVVHGDRVAVERLIEHPDVAAISFVGSTPVARSIYAAATATGKRVQALGGAKNHMVVLPDADLDLAADAAVSAAYGSAGERCMAVSVAVTVGDVGDAFVDAVAQRIPDVIVGDGRDTASQMGPLITDEHRDRVASYLASGAEQGAEVIVDGREADLPDEGFFLGPSIVDRVTPEMDCYRDEIFGPVLSVVRVDTYDQAVELISQNPWGNGAAIFTRDGGAARRFEQDADAGMVGVNVPIPVPIAAYSFGGWGASLFGDLHMYGPDGIRFYTRTKAVTTRWPSPESSSVDLGFPQNQ